MRHGSIKLVEKAMLRCPYLLWFFNTVLAWANHYLFQTFNHGFITKTLQSALYWECCCVYDRSCWIKHAHCSLDQVLFFEDELQSVVW